MEQQIYELNLNDYIEIVRKRKVEAISVFLAVCIMVFIYVSFQKPKYKAVLVFSVNVLEKLPTEMLFSTRERLAPEDMLLDYAKQAESKPVIEKALKNLNQISDKMSELERSEYVKGFSASVSALIVPKTYMIRIEVVSRNAQFAADLANEVYKVFKETNILEKNKVQRNATIFIQERLNEVSKKVDEEEQRLRALTTQGVIGVAETILRRIDELEQRRLSLLSTYTENYPEVVSLTEEIEELRAQLKILPNEEFEHGTLKRNLDVDRKLFEALKTKLQEAQIREAEKIDNLVLIDNAFPPDSPFYPNKRQFFIIAILLGGAISVVTVVFLEQVMETSIGRIGDLEELIKVNVIGVIPYFSEKAKTTVKKGVKDFFKLSSGRGRTYENMRAKILEIHSKSSIFVEAFRILATNIQVIFGKGGRIKNKIILITSSNPEEGKSTISSNVSITLAQMGYRVLLIDSDLRKPAVQKIFGLSDKSAGFTDVLLGNFKLDELETTVMKTATDLMLGDAGAENVINNPWMNNLHILTAGSVFPNPINLLNSEKLKETLEYLKERYDLVIMDAAPLFAVSDTSIILPKVDGVIIVYRVGTTSRITLKRAKAQVESIRGKDSVNGLILNNVVPEISKDSYYYYHKAYHTDEAETPSENPPSKDTLKEGAA